MTTNHPAHGPVSLDRLHQIREHLLHDTQYSNGGNRAYILADVLKVIDGAIAAFGAEPVAWMIIDIDTGEKIIRPDRSYFEGPCQPLYAAPPAPASVPDSIDNAGGVCCEVSFADGWNAFRATMLQSFGNSEQLDEVGSWNNYRNTPTAQAGNSQVTPDDVLRMDWLVSKTVDVREPMVYGSHSILWSQTITDEDDDYHATKLREQIDAAMAAEQAAAPQQENV
ncbi:hypothetical protein [Citrobacter portucalensis]|uniref:hypothetical protein n=1 Tax=Citrobacter portucalensis TaxID=1639133 RepID=UPI002B23C1EF|nr:hypothetical protein [Citrobacter portucalensis]MEB0900192.1 hypothetical protein [Citrobacter portucalensis]